MLFRRVSLTVLNSITRVLLCALAAGAFDLSHAQRDSKLPKVGQVFFVDRATADPYDQAFRAGLRELGYVEGENVVMVARYANDDDKQVRPLLRELLALPVDVLLVSPGAVQTAKEATTSVPIVCANMLDAVEAGLVASLSRPGGNLTGLTYQEAASDSKRLELARELVPALKRLAVLFDATFEPNAFSERIRLLAQKQGITAHMFGVRSLEQIESALPAIERIRPQAMIVYGSPRFAQHRRTILDFASRRFPVIADAAENAKAGAIVSYGENDLEMYKRSAVYVDKILKGARPADLPIEQATKFDFVVNLKSAKMLGITIPESMMVRATEIIR